MWKKLDKNFGKKLDELFWGVSTLVGDLFWDPFSGTNPILGSTNRDTKKKFVGLVLKWVTLFGSHAIAKTSIYVQLVKWPKKNFIRAKIVQLHFPLTDSCYGFEHVWSPIQLLTGPDVA